MINYGIGNANKRINKFYSDLINEIQSYAMEEIQKGFQYPVTGKLRGRLFKKVLYSMSSKDRKNFLELRGSFMYNGSGYNLPS